MAPKPAILGYDDEIAPGTVITGFDAILPLDDTQCLAHIAASAARLLPEAVSRKRLHVIANGPSALLADLENLYPTLALNGSIKLFTDAGLAPTYWAGCDPQAVLADYLPDNPPESTVYFVASKAHPSVFNKLKDRDVRVWHLMDYPAPGRARIALASSVTMSAAWLMHRLGFTDFEFWGWDGCFMDGRHHASDASSWGDAPLHVNYGGKVVGDEVIGGRTFPTTRSWAAEAHCAEQFFQLAKYFDIGVTLHGDGMFKAAQGLILKD